ncbi:MAG: chemotaxis protein CheV [Gammaproteobacteria bacterium]|nr:chemotaxis protein CheV [Gammaproteobacteria bacterium]
MKEVTQSRQDILLFSLGGRQSFGINVLKIKEIISFERLNKIPGSHPAVVGLTRLRGAPLGVIDLSAAIGMREMATGGELESCSIIISEFNRSLQGFLIKRVDRIISLEWEDILPPPSASGRGSYITGVTRVDEQLVEIIDVERVLSEVIPPEDQDADQFHMDTELFSLLKSKRVLVVDDSVIARKQVGRTLDMVGVDYIMVKDGREALDRLRELQSQGEQVDLIISDIEMPEMDGYSLTREVRKDQDESLSSVYILLHTSLAGAVSKDNALASGADASLTKFATEELVEAVIKGLAR